MLQLLRRRVWTSWHVCSQQIHQQRLPLLQDAERGREWQHAVVAMLHAAVKAASPELLRKEERVVVCIRQVSGGEPRSYCLPAQCACL
jgi:hypothetical protein